jgi:hypothetical protein
MTQLNTPETNKSLRATRIEGASVTKVACLGECMIELCEMADGRFSRVYGGDTLNTAVYLARLGIAVDCSITAVQLGGAEKHLPSVGV